MRLEILAENMTPAPFGDEEKIIVALGANDRTEGSEAGVRDGAGREPSVPICIVRIRRVVQHRSRNRAAKLRA